MPIDDELIITPKQPPPPQPDGAEEAFASMRRADRQIKLLLIAAGLFGVFAVVWSLF